jgi:hypothetical protein
MSRNQRRKKRNKPGGGQNANRNANRDNTQAPSAPAVHRRSSTETKSALKTTESIAYALAVLAVIITALSVDADGQGGNDPFGAESALRYITFLTIGYALARGLAKSGSHENRIERHTDVDDAARTDVVHDEDDRQDDRQDDDQHHGHGDSERAGDDDTAGATAVPSDQVQRPAPEDVDGEAVTPR